MKKLTLVLLLLAVGASCNEPEAKAPVKGEPSFEYLEHDGRCFLLYKEIHGNIVQHLGITRIPCKKPSAQEAPKKEAPEKEALEKKGKKKRRHARP